MKNNTMKALVYHGPNQLSLDDVPVPRIQKPEDVILRVTLATPCTSDVHIVVGHMPLVKPPSILGHEFCGVIEEMGSAVQGYKVGDRVHCISAVFCGQCSMCQKGHIVYCEKGGVFGTVKGIDGALAEYVRLPYATEIMVPIPEELMDEDVLLLADMLGTAWYGVSNAEVKKGDTVTVFGVGPVGMCACLLAKNVFEAETVIAVDLLQYRLDAVKNEGFADYVLNPNDGDVVKKIREITGGHMANASVETAGVASTINSAIRSTGPYGIVASVAIFPKPIEVPIHFMTHKNIQLRTGIQNCDGLDTMLDLIKAGKINTRFMQTHRSPLNDILKAMDIFGGNKDGCIKYLITPYER
jgi:alcohol dehydrogenase